MNLSRLSSVFYAGIVAALGASASTAGAQQVYSLDSSGTWNAYLVDLTARTWDDARVNANSQMFGGISGNLAVMASADEDSRVYQIAGSGRRDVWFGLTDSDVASSLDGYNAATAIGASEGNFKWLTNEPFVYTNWNAGEPNNSGNEDAGQLGVNGKWNDNQAGSSLGQVNTTFASIIEFRLQFTAAQMAQTSSLKVVSYKSGSTAIINLATADALIAGNDQARKTTSYYTRASMTDSGAEGDFINDPGVVGVANEDNYAVVSTGYMVVQPGKGGDYVFRLNADDGQRLRIDIDGDGVFENIITDDVLSAPHNADSGTIAFAPGRYALEWTWFENGGGAEGELSASYAGGAFVALGDAGGLGLTQIPEPSAALLGGLGLLCLLRRRRSSN